MKIKAVGAYSAKQPLEPMDITRREPGPHDVKLIHKSQVIHQVIAAKLDHLGDIVVYHPAALFLMKIIDYHAGIQTHLNFELVIQSALCLGYGDRRQVGTDNFDIPVTDIKQLVSDRDGD